MKLKFELVNGYGILVDQEAEITKNGYHYNPRTKTATKNSKVGNNALIKYAECIEIIFAEPELKLEDVPVFEWRDFEVEKLTNEKYNDPLVFSNGNIKKLGFIEGYKSNPAKYTENDLRNAMKMMMQGSIVDDEYYPLFSEDEIMQSLQKCPEYVVMESEGYCGSPYTTERCPKCIDSCDRAYTRLKLFTNSEGKQQGTVKELIWK